MEDIRPYGDLSEQELLEFLSEIEDGDEDIKEAQLKAEKNIALEEEQTSVFELPEDVACLRSDEIECRANSTSVKMIKQKAQHLKEDRIRIQRQAFNQEFIRLSDPIGNDNIKQLVTLLVKEHTRMLTKYEAFINRRLSTLLNPLIPRRLRACKKLYPNSIRVSPGFLYRASEEYGQGLTFWAMPDIPYYFAQNTEQKILTDCKPEFLISIDKAVSLYHEHKNKRAKKELRYASIMVQKGVYTYFDLLKLNPFWFEILYNNLIEKA